jgi:hypothetical protein
MARGGPLLVFLGLAACASSPPGGPADAGGEPVDAAQQPPPYAGPITLPVRTTIEWSGPPNEGSIEAARFTDGRGTLRFEGVDLPAVVYEKIPFGEYTLASIVATLPDNLLVTYAYCKDGGVTAFYFESLRYTVSVQTPLSSAGSCVFTDEPSSGEASFIRPSAPLAYAAPEDAAKVEGARLSLDGGLGTIELEGRRYDLRVFTTVDCAKCGGAGWFELHVTVRRDQELAFAILYLAPDKPAEVQLAHGIRLDVPALWPRDEVLPAAWTLK